VSDIYAGAEKVHILNESRGCTLEVVISRMRLKNSELRFVLVSATVPNIGDVATWISSNDKQPASIREVRSFGCSLLVITRQPVWRRLQAMQIEEVCLRISKEESE
jgi:replicative superfamily II helicase